MSAYGVRAHFARSTTTSWSSSTGTVYPAIRRLRGAGYLDASSPTGPRRSELLTLTDKGKRALRDWLTVVTPQLGGSTADPIRTRVHFLAALDMLTREKVLADYCAATRDSIRKLEAHAAEPVETAVDRSERLGTLGALAELRARLEWLDWVESELG